MEKKKIHVPSLILMIIAAVFALLSPIVTYVCGIISLVMSISKRKTHKTTYAIVINIIALAAAVAVHVYNTIVIMNQIAG